MYIVNSLVRSFVTRCKYANGLDKHQKRDLRMSHMLYDSSVAI